MRDLINVISLLFEKTIKQSMIDEKFDEKEAIEKKDLKSFSC